MGRKPSTEKKKRGPKRPKRGSKPLKNDECTQSLRELPAKKKSRELGNISAIAKIDMQAVTAEDVVTPKTQDGEVILDVECGPNKAILFLSKLCQGSKGPCISFQGAWLTPNEFQFVSGRETAKDWKRSIRHNGKSIKLLMAKDILTITPDNTKNGESIPKKKSKSTLDKKKSSQENVGNDEVKSDNVPTCPEAENKENVQVENNNSKDSDDVKNENPKSTADGDNRIEESWEGGSDTTEPVDYDFDKSGFDEETSNVISECDAIKAVAKLKTEDDDRTKSNSVVLDEVAQKITPSNPDKILQKEGNDLERKAESFDCNHISAKINGGKNESKSETCSSDNEAKDNDVSDEIKCSSKEETKEISAVPVLKIKKRRIAKKNKTKGPDIKPPKKAVSEKIKKRKRKLSVSTTKAAKYTEGKKLASEDSDRGKSGGKPADDNFELGDKNDNSVTANDRNSCPRESRLGSIINQLRESREKRKPGRSGDDVFKGENDESEKGEISEYADSNIPVLSTETKDGENRGKKHTSNREKSPRKHSQVKRSPYYMKKEAKQKYLEIFERDVDVCSSPESNESPAISSSDIKKHPESRVKTESESMCISNPDHPETSSVTHTEKMDENRNRYKPCKTFSIDSIISTSQSSTQKSSPESTKKAIPTISIPNTVSSHSNISDHSPTDYNIFSRSPNSTSPSRTNSPLSRKEHILQRTGSPRNGVRSPPPNPTDHYNEYMKALAATYSILPSPTLYDHYFRSPEIPFHPGYVHPYMFPSFTDHKHHLQSFAAAARPQTIKSKSVTSPKVASPAVLDLTRLPHMMTSSHTITSTTPSSESSKRATKRPLVSSESVLDLSFKRPKLHNSNIFDIPKCNIESPFSNSAYRLHQELYGAWRNEHLPSQNSKQTHTSNGKASKHDGSSCHCAENSSKDIRNWSVEKVGQFLKSLEGCSPYVKIFQENKISGKYLPLLTTDQLVLHLGMKDKPARILCEAVTNKVLELRKYSIPCAYCKTKKNHLQSQVCF